MAIPQVPEQDPSQNEIDLPRVLNPYLGVWWTAQTVSDVPESVVGWLVAQGFEVTGITQDVTTTPPTNYFSLSKQAMTPQQVLLSLCNSYTIAANEARDANQIRYNEVVSDWKEMIQTSHEHFNAQTTDQNTQAGVYITDLGTYMDEIETLIADNRTQIIADADAAKTALETMDTKLSDLETNAQSTATTIGTLLNDQQTSLTAFIAAYDAKLTEIDQDFAEHLAAILLEVSSLEDVLDDHVSAYEGQFATLASNYDAYLADINSDLSDVVANVTNYTAEVDAILDQLSADYQAVDTELTATKTAAGTLVGTHASDYQAILDLLVSDYNTHVDVATDFLVNLGATELARINEQFAAALAEQIQQLTNRGLYSSVMVTDISQRNTRDRDEQIQLLNDRLNREKLDNQHKLYEQQVSMRARSLDGADKLHAVQQEVLRYQATLVSSLYTLLQESRNRILAGRGAIFGAKDTNTKFGITIKADLYDKLQNVRLRTIESADRVYQLRDVFAKWKNTQTQSLFEQLQQIQSKHIAAIDRKFVSSQEVNRSEMTQRDTLLQQLQAALTGLTSGKERYSTALMQIASSLAEHKHKAILERMNTAVQRLDGWKSIAEQNRQLLAYQLDERNKLLIGLYGFVERREDVSPEWSDMSKMIAGLGDSGGGWITP